MPAHVRELVPQHEIEFIACQRVGARRGKHDGGADDAHEQRHACDARREDARHDRQRETRHEIERATDDVRGRRNRVSPQASYGSQRSPETRGVQREHRQPDRDEHDRPERCVRERHARRGHVGMRRAIDDVVRDGDVIRRRKGEGRSQLTVDERHSRRAAVFDNRHGAFRYRQPWQDHARKRQQTDHELQRHGPPQPCARGRRQGWHRADDGPHDEGAHGAVDRRARQPDEHVEAAGPEQVGERQQRHDDLFVRCSRRATRACSSASSSGVTFASSLR